MLAVATENELQACSSLDREVTIHATHSYQHAERQRRTARAVSAASRPASLSIAQDRLLAVMDREVKRFSPRRRAGKPISDCPTSAGRLPSTASRFGSGCGGRLIDSMLEGKLLETIEDKDRLGRITGLAVEGDTTAGRRRDAIARFTCIAAASGSARWAAT